MNALIDGVRASLDYDGSKRFGISIHWYSDKGFGCIDISQHVVDGEVHFMIDSEQMGKEFVKQVLCKIVDQAKMEKSHQVKGKESESK